MLENILEKIGINTGSVNGEECIIFNKKSLIISFVYAFTSGFLSGIALFMLL